MTTLHIEHRISDLATWQSAFERFAQQRERAGVQAARVAQPVDDPGYVVVDLEFESADEARQFLGFLRTQVWADPSSSPALRGKPHALILEPTAAAMSPTVPQNR